MCLSCAQGLEGCFGEPISSMEDTFLEGGWGATRCRYIPADGTSFDLLSSNTRKPSSLIPSVLCTRGRPGLGAGPHVRGGKENCWVVWASLV